MRAMAVVLDEPGVASGVGQGLWIALGAVVVLVVLVLSVLVGVMRTKRPRALAVVRQFNRRFNNPRMLRHAGEPGSQLAVVRHVGRRSGAPYSTPIGVVPMGADFLAILSYGPETDWLRNIRAAGVAELVTEGQNIRVAAARFIGRAEALPSLPRSQRPFVHLLGVTDFLVLRRVDGTSGTAR